MNNPFRKIPQVSKLIEAFKGEYPEEYIKRAAREVTEKFRKDIREGRRRDVEGIYEEVRKRIEDMMKTKLRRVINATGIVINTNLGRAPLNTEVLEFITTVAKGYSNLEYDLEEGRRGSRNTHVEDYLKELTGAESALVVNNNAGAVFLVLNTLAKGREVIISRGELVEIGGGFRIPDIMRASGAVLIEVGTTNRTRLSDYESVINENTALLMKVHRSNFYMEGFVEEVSPGELSELGKRYGIPTYYDAGSGLLVDPKTLGIPSREPSFKECVSAGIDVVSGSGDKLLGGPQAGIIVGRKAYLEGIKKNPMARALRIDKLTLAGLEMTLRLFIEGRYRDIPVVRMLTEGEEILKKRAKRLLRLLRNVEGLETEILRDIARPGGGSLPELELPTYCVAVKHRDLSVEEISKRLRSTDPPVIGRIKEDKLLLDMRTVFDRELKEIEKAIISIL